MEYPQKIRGKEINMHKLDCLHGLYTFLWKSWNENSHSWPLQTVAHVIHVFHRNTVHQGDKIKFIIIISLQATLCCLSAIQDPPKSAEILEHAAGNALSCVRFFCGTVIIILERNFQLHPNVQFCLTIHDTVNHCPARYS